MRPDGVTASGFRGGGSQAPASQHAACKKCEIFFVGGDMDVPTVTAARIGQLQNRDGERNQLAFGRLPYLALSKPAEDSAMDQSGRAQPVQISLQGRW